MGMFCTFFMPLDMLGWKTHKHTHTHTHTHRRLTTVWAPRPSCRISPVSSSNSLMPYLGRLKVALVYQPIDKILKLFKTFGTLLFPLTVHTPLNQTGFEMCRAVKLPFRQTWESLFDTSER